MKWSGDEQVLANLAKLQKDIPYAASFALNGAMFEARKENQQKLPVWLDLGRGRSFITKSLIVEKANKQTLTSTIGFLDRVPLIHLLEEGGTRFPLKKTIAVPDATDFGTKSPPRSKTPSKLLQRPDVFSGTVRGVAGIWQRKKRKKASTLNLLYAYNRTTSYDQGQMHFYSTVQEVLNKEFEPRLQAAIQHIMSK